MMPYDHDLLKAAFDAVCATPPEAVSEVEALWGATHLMRLPKASAVELQGDIRSHGTVVLRADEDLPKIEAIISDWRAHLGWSPAEQDEREETREPGFYWVKLVPTLPFDPDGSWVIGEWKDGWWWLAGFDENCAKQIDRVDEKRLRR